MREKPLVCPLGSLLEEKSRHLPGSTGYCFILANKKSSAAGQPGAAFSETESTEVPGRC